MHFGFCTKSVAWEMIWNNSSRQIRSSTKRFILGHQPDSSRTFDGANCRWSLDLGSKTWRFLTWLFFIPATLRNILGVFRTSFYSIAMFCAWFCCCDVVEWWVTLKIHAGSAKLQLFSRFVSEWKMITSLKSYGFCHIPLGNKPICVPVMTRDRLIKIIKLISVIICICSSRKLKAAADFSIASSSKDGLIHGAIYRWQLQSEAVPKLPKALSQIDIKRNRNGVQIMVLRVTEQDGRLWWGYPMVQER